MSEAQNAWSPSPGPRTLADLQTEISRFVMMPQSDEVLELSLSGVKDGIDTLNMRPNGWLWTKESDTITFETGTAEYGLTAEFKKNRHFELNDENGYSVAKLSYYDWKHYLEKFPDTTTAGDPCAYSLMNAHRLGNLSLNVRPTTEWVTKYPTGTLYYFRRVQYPANPEEAIDAPAEVCSFLLWHGRFYVASIFDTAKAAMAQREAEKRWRMLIADDNESTDWD